MLTALNAEMRRRGHGPDELPDLIDWLDLCALGTLCDMAPLKGVNRAFVKQGLKVVARDQSPGIVALADVSGRKAPRTVTDLTFGIGPQLNAGGRLGDPWLATKLLATEDHAEARKIAVELHGLNLARQSLERDILEAAKRQAEGIIQASPDVPVLVTHGDGWHPGVIGIVAGRLKETFHRPALVLGYGDGLGDGAKGSARSIEGVNIGDAISASVKAGISRSGGGHAMAAGVSIDIDRIGELTRFLTGQFKATQGEQAAARVLDVDLTVFFGGLTPGLITEINSTGPFGAGAPKPVLGARNILVDDIRSVGANHLKLRLRDETGSIDAIAWRAADTPLGDVLRKGVPVAVAGYASLNVWNGRTTAQLELVDALGGNRLRRIETFEV